MNETKVVIKRKIVEIDEARCNGCGLCIPNCREGALAIVNGKAKLVKDRFCDGLGACLGHCPQDAIHIIEREADVFDEAAVPSGGCPSSRAIFFTERLNKGRETAPKDGKAAETLSRLANWPVQLMLVSPQAPYLKGADLLIAADCVGFSLPGFHEQLLEGKVLLVACPKLDQADVYVDKLAQIFAFNSLRSLTIAHMEVPCCFGLRMIIEDAQERAKKDIKINEVVVSVEGRLSGE
jgi:ferredoxin